MQTQVEVEGLKELRRGLRAFDAGLAKEFANIGKRITGRVVDRAKPDIPVDTGRLKRSARATADAAVLGGARAPYVEYVYWRAHARWYHVEADKLIRSGVLPDEYERGLAQLAERVGLEVERR